MKFDSSSWPHLTHKYQVNSDFNNSSVLEFILVKAELNHPLSQFEKNFLKKNKLFEALQIIDHQEKTYSQLSRKLQDNFYKLTRQYEIFFPDSWEDNPLYLICLKLEQEEPLTKSELLWLRNQSKTEIKKLAIFYEKNQSFCQLKRKYEITQRPDLLFNSHLASILNKLEVKQPLTPQDIKYLEKEKINHILEMVKQQELQRELDYANLREKYQVIDYPDTSPDSRLCTILKQIDLQFTIDDSTIQWVLENELLTVHFAILKLKYQVTQFENLSINSNLYKILKKLEAGHFILPESDINFLKKRKLEQVISYGQEQYTNQLINKIEEDGNLTDEEIQWLKQNDRESVIVTAQKKDFQRLKHKYGVSNYQDTSLSSELYTILQKLEQNIRLEGIEFAWLNETKIKQDYYQDYNQDYYRDYYQYYYREISLFSHEIRVTYHRIEAQFYEAEYQRTKNKWNLPNISSHWRKAEQPQQALEATENVKIESIKDQKLKSAILTTKGGAYRDLNHYDQAENCAKQAINYQPDSHHPYTLMGAICYDTGRCDEGYSWFKKAIERGASPRDIDNEIKRVLEKSKGEDREKLIQFLLDKDPYYYAWVKKKYAKKDEPFESIS